jgi:MoaE-MoaD fusion protein
MKIGVLFFGQMKDIVGKPADTIDLPEGARAHDVVTHYSRQIPRVALMKASLAISVNREYAPADRLLAAGDEVALLPPVSGGVSSGEAIAPEIRIVREKIDAKGMVENIKKQLSAPGDGALVVFDGVVRNNTRGRPTLYLEYEAYEPMALRQMESLAREARVRFQVRSVSMVHRVGRLKIGETSILIVVASEHRAAAFDACRWIIDTLKKTVPIWKKEFFEDGAVWASGDPFPEEIRMAETSTSDGPHHSQ